MSVGAEEAQPVGDAFAGEVARRQVPVARKDDSLGEQLVGAAVRQTVEIATEDHWQYGNNNRWVLVLVLVLVVLFAVVVVVLLGAAAWAGVILDLFD